VTQDARAALLATLEENRSLAERSPSPFYATLLARMIDDVGAGDSPTWSRLEPYANEPATG
jgi:hypothetical protein